MISCAVVKDDFNKIKNNISRGNGNNSSVKSRKYTFPKPCPISSFMCTQAMFLEECDLAFATMSGTVPLKYGDNYEESGLPFHYSMDFNKCVDIVYYLSGKSIPYHFQKVLDRNLCIENGSSWQKCDKKYGME